jgi:HK97 family phage prohead protease
MSNIAAFQKRIAGIHHQRVAWSAADITRIARHYGVDASDLPAAPAPTRRFSEAVLKGGTSDTVATFIASDSSQDRMGDVIDQSGWQLSAFRRNGVILFAHDSGSLPVGKATSIGVVNDKLMVTVRFAATGMGRAVAGMVSDGFLKAVSVGFAPVSFKFSGDPARKGGIDFAQAELLEISIVPVPANPNALLQSVVEAKSATTPKAKAKAARQRDLEIIKLRQAPLTAKEQRALDIARLRLK